MARQDGPLTLCVINMKGGVGKSTIAALLARHAVLSRSKEVLAIDLDPQANLSQGLLHSRYNTFLNQRLPSVVEVFDGYRPPSKTRTKPTPLSPNDAVHRVFSTGAAALDIIPSRFDFSDNLSDAVRPDPKVLARFLSDRFASKDLIIIDCAPTESILTQAAYHASGIVLVPVKPEYFATIGFPLLKQSLATFRAQNRGHNIDVAGVVINNGFYDGGNDGGPEKARAVKEIEAETAKNDWHVFKRQIPFSRGFPKIMRGDHSHSGNAVLFHYFAKEFFDHVGL